LQLNGRAPTLQQILGDKAWRTEFTKFLSLEFCAENIKLFEAIQSYRTIKSKIDRVEEAKKIIRQYIGPRARTPVNLPGVTIEKLLSSLKEEHPLSRKLFDEAQTQIIDLLNGGEYQRFLQTKNMMGTNNNNNNNTSLESQIPLNPISLAINPSTSFVESESSLEDRNSASSSDFA